MLACILGCFFLNSFSQTTNYAINNDGTGFVQTSTIMNELNGLAEATVQIWIKPVEWVKGAQLYNQSNLVIELGENQSLIVKAGASSVTCTPEIALNIWSQLTMVYDNGAVKLYVNNEQKETTGTLPAILPDAVNTCYIGKNFKGQIDEIRVWRKALEQKDFFWNNTLNKFNPNYDTLVSYWKCDQEQCENLVDYQFAHHGIINNMQRVAVEDNAIMRYRVVTGYTNLMRFTDRGNINRDMFLMTNDLILLSAKVQQDGSLFPEYPDNSAVPVNVSYLAEFEGRKGVMDFHGIGSKMVAEDGRAPFDPTERFGCGTPNVATVSGWIYIDKWVEGAGIFSNYQDEDNCMVIKLGQEANKEIVVDFCGTIATLKNQVEVGKWHYLSVCFKPAEGEITGRRFNPVFISVDYVMHDKISSKTVELSGKDMTIKVVPVFANSTITLGDNLDGKLDENDLTSYMNYTGLRKGDADFDYVSKGDLNNNGLIDAYDISAVAIELEDGVSRQATPPVAGNLSIRTTKQTYHAGEVMKVIVKGIDLQSVNALSFALPYDTKDWEFVAVETPNMKKMKNLTYDRLHTNGTKALYPTFVNLGEKPYLEGNEELIILMFKARRAVKFNLKAQDGILVDKNMNVIKVDF